MSLLLNVGPRRVPAYTATATSRTTPGKLFELGVNPSRYSLTLDTSNGVFKLSARTSSPVGLPRHEPPHSCCSRSMMSGRLLVASSITRLSSEYHCRYFASVGLPR